MSADVLTALIIGFMAGVVIASWLWLDAVKRQRALNAQAWTVARGYRTLLAQHLDETNPYGLARINAALERHGLAPLRSDAP